MLRGVSDDEKLSQIYGLYEECLHKYGNLNVWKHFVDLFCYLGLTAVIEGKVFCVHGGISQDIKTLD